MVRKYISLFELLNMVRGIEDLLMEDDNTFLKERYRKIKEIYDKSRMLGHVRAVKVKAKVLCLF